MEGEQETQAGRSESSSPFTSLSENEKELVFLNSCLSHPRQLHALVTSSLRKDDCAKDATVEEGEDDRRVSSLLQDDVQAYLRALYAKYAASAVLRRQLVSANALAYLQCLTDEHGRVDFVNCAADPAFVATALRIDYDGDRVLKVVLRFPPLRNGSESEEDIVKEIRTCERIGQGSFGTVYRALCDGYPNLALKIATGKSTRLRQELDVLSKTCTRGKLLLPRFEFGALNKSCDLIVVGMELCVPRTMHDFLIGEKLRNEADKLFIAYQAAQAVSYVHETGCIHRDVKLQNFVFDLYGNAKLIDFGLACNTLKPPAGDVVAGTISFMAPEMAHNALYKERRVSVGAPGDIWSLGIVFFSIFTQRNPYPSFPVSTTDDEEDNDENDAAGEAEVASHERPAQIKGGLNSQVSQSTRQRLTNKRLLECVAAGEWRWPKECSISPELKALVESILVKDASKRPTITDILSRKIFNLRRRAPPVALEHFLGVQDDFFLSRDEAHLLRAVEERDTKVNASLMTSRMQSVDGTDSDKENNSSGASQKSKKEGTEYGTETPVRANGSLKVVTREDGEVGGVPAIQIYDIRASTKKRSKPIREISQVIAEETAKANPTSTAPSRSRSRKGSLSAVQSRVASRASSLGSNKARPPKHSGKRAASAASSIGPESSTVGGGNLFDEVDEDADVNHAEALAAIGASVSEHGKKGAANMHDVPLTMPRGGEGTGGSAATGGASSLSSGQPLIESRTDTDATVTPAALVSSDRMLSSARATSTNGKRARSTSLLESRDVPNATKDVGNEEPGSEADDDVADSASQRKVKQRVAKQSSKSRSRETSLHKPSSSILAGLVSDNGFLSSTSRARSDASSRRATPRSRTASVRVKRDGSAATNAAARHTEDATQPRPVYPSKTLTPPSAQVTARARSTTPQDQLIPSVRTTAAVRSVGMAAGAKTSTPTPPNRRRSLPHRSAQATPVVDVDKDEDSEGTHPRAADEDLSSVTIVAPELLHEEAARRRLVSSTLLLEHEWLLASFRLTIEEDQERYNITWLAEEQEKSASHPHKFKELFKIPSKKYQYGFVCDYCDYDFVPYGKTPTNLHFYHCTCGRDVCPECFEEYQRKCTCTCCGIVHPNSCALRDHVRTTGGRGGGRAVVGGASTANKRDAEKPAGKAAAKVAAKKGAAKPSRGGGRRVREDDDDFGGLDDDAIDEGPVDLSLSRGLAGRRKAARGESHTESDNYSHKPGGGKARAGGPSVHLSIASMRQRELTEGYDPEDLIAPSAGGSGRRRPSAGRFEKHVDAVPEGPWRPFAKTGRGAASTSASSSSVSAPTREERDTILGGEWVRHFYLFPDAGMGAVGDADEEPYAFVYNIQPGRLGAVFLSSDFPMHSAVYSRPAHQLCIVDQVNMLAEQDFARVVSVPAARGSPGLRDVLATMEHISQFNDRECQRRRPPGTVSVYQPPRGSVGTKDDPFVFVRWFRFNEDRSLSAFLLSNGAVQVFVNNEFELRWFDENRKFLVRHNGVCEVVGDNTFALAPAINQLLYGSFDA